MRDLWITSEAQGSDLIVATHGRSFWILDDISPLRELAGMKAEEAMLFKPAAAIRARRSTYTDTPMPIDEPEGENPPEGAIIDYSLPTGITGAVVLEVLDSAGKVVRKYASTDAPYATPEELAKQLIPLYWIKMPKALPATPGMHRWVWDLRYTTPTATHYEYPISAVPHRTPRTPQGPLALPGRYTVRLTAGGKTLTAPLTVKLDPRVKITPAELAALFQAESRLAGMTSSSAEAALEAHSLREQIAKLASSATGGVKDSLAACDKQLAELLDGKKDPAGKETTPGIDDVSGEAAGLYTQVGQSDAAPTAAQLKAAAHADEETEESLRAWKQWKDASLPNLNQQLQAAHLSELHPEQRPEAMPESGDED
jgi:hypothetical protein